MDQLPGKFNNLENQEENQRKLWQILIYTTYSDKTSTIVWEWNATSFAKFFSAVLLFAVKFC